MQYTFYSILITRRNIIGFCFPKGQLVPWPKCRYVGEDINLHHSWCEIRPLDFNGLWQFQGCLAWQQEIKDCQNRQEKVDVIAGWSYLYYVCEDVDSWFHKTTNHSFSFTWRLIMSRLIDWFWVNYYIITHCLVVLRMGGGGPQTHLYDLRFKRLYINCTSTQ